MEPSDKYELVSILIWEEGERSSRERVELAFKKGSREVFKTQSTIYDGAFYAIIVNG